jgi:hypothetical protein
MLVLGSIIALIVVAALASYAGKTTQTPRPGDVKFTGDQVVEVINARSEQK